MGFWVRLGSHASTGLSAALRLCLRERVDVCGEAARREVDGVLILERGRERELERDWHAEEDLEGCLRD